MAAFDTNTEAQASSRMRRMVERLSGPRERRLVTLLIWPAVLLIFCFLLPLLLLGQVSTAPRDGNGLWSPGFTFAPYVNALADIDTLLYSAGLALVVATVGLIVAFPLTYLISRMGRRSQVAWLIFVLVTLSLSDVLVAFAWEVMLSKRVGLSNLLVMLGLLDQPISLVPSNGAVVSCLLYLVIPFSVVTLYPGLSRLDRCLIEAARTMGASPMRSFLTVVLPLSKGPMLTTFSLATVLTMGAYVAPMALGHPQNWTMAILINRTALSAQDLPQAAAMSIVLLAVTLVLVIGTRILGKPRRFPS